MLPAEFEWNYPAIIENVDLICSSAATILDQFVIPRNDRFAIDLLMREALNNSVIHGSQNDPTIDLTCNLQVSKNGVTIRIKDGGLGFDWRNASFCPSESRSESGRGMSIYALYANSIHFIDPGNCVTLTRRVSEGEIYARNTDQSK